MKTINLLIVDRKMRTTEIEINAIQFQSLGIDFSKIKENKGKRELQNSINDFIGNKKESSV